MDMKVLSSKLRKRFEITAVAAVKAVEEAPDGQWLSGSEWQVREAFQALMADCYREIVQAKLDATPSAKQAAFSPSGTTRRNAARQRSASG